MDMQLLHQIQTEKKVVVHEPNSLERKKLHQWAQLNGIFHVSYCDGKWASKTNRSYYCSTCVKWTTNVTTHRCCGDDLDCGDFSIHCNDCEGFGSLGDLGQIVWHQDAWMELRELDGCRRPKIYEENNAIAFASDIVLLKDIFEEKGIKPVKAEKWIKKRELARAKE